MCEADANVVNLLNQMLVLPGSSNKSRQKNVIVDSINGGTVALNARGGKSTFLSKYIKRIISSNNQYQICNVDRLSIILKKTLT